MQENRLEGSNWIPQQFLFDFRYFDIWWIIISIYDVVVVVIDYLVCSIIGPNFGILKGFLKLNQMVGVYSHQSHKWPRVYFVLFYPKLLGAQICMGSQVVGILQIHLEELEAEGFTS